MIHEVDQGIDQEGIMTNEKGKTGNMRKIIGVKNRVAQGKYCSTGSQKGKILLNFPLIWQENNSEHGQTTMVNTKYRALAVALFEST